MKIWFPVIEGRSGSDIFSKRLAGALDRRGIDTEVTMFPGHFEFLPHFLPGKRLPFNVDIIHTNSWNGFAFSGYARALVVTHHLDIHNPEFNRYRSIPQRLYHELLIRQYEKKSFKAAGCITAVSATTAEGVKRVLPDCPPVSVIPTWVDTEVFKPARESRNHGGRFRFLFVGNPSRRKGIDLVARIAEHLGNRCEILVTAGLKSLYSLPVMENISLVQRIDDEADMVSLYQSVDALLFPSRLEGFSLVVLEAMACGLPVIASAIPDMEKAVINGKTGFLCEVNNIEEFVTAASRLINDLELGARLGHNARRHVEAKFSEKAVVPKYIDIYKKLLNRQIITVRL